MSEDKKKNEIQSNEIVTNISEQIQELIAQGNARRVVIRKADGETLFDVTMTVAFAVTAAVLIFVPGGFFLGLLAVVGSIIARLRVDILREVKDDDKTITGEIIDSDS